MCLYVLALSVSERRAPSDLRFQKHQFKANMCLCVACAVWHNERGGGKWFRALRRPCFGRKTLYAFKQLMKNERDLSVINMRAFWPWLQTGLTGILNFFTGEGRTPWGIEGKQQSRGKREKTAVINLEFDGLRRSPRTATLMFFSFCRDFLFLSFFHPFVVCIVELLVLRNTKPVRKIPAEKRTRRKNALKTKSQDQKCWNSDYGDTGETKSGQQSALMGTGPSAGRRGVI